MTPQDAPVLSDGTLSTLGVWREKAIILTGSEQSPAVQMLDKKIGKYGPDEIVIAEETQMINLILNMG